MKDDKFNDCSHVSQTTRTEYEAIIQSAGLVINLLILLNIICWTYLKIKYFQGERDDGIEKRAGDGRLAALSPIFTSRAHFSET